MELKAKKTFLSKEGIRKKGDIFKVERKDVAKQMIDKGLAEEAAKKLEGFKTHKEIDDYANLIEFEGDLDGNLDEKRAAIYEFLNK